MNMLLIGAVVAVAVVAVLLVVVDQVLIHRR
jgi:hypothetical protein